MDRELALLQRDKAALEKRMQETQKALEKL
jgi:hypothetical protein